MGVRWKEKKNKEGVARWSTVVSKVMCDRKREEVSGGKTCKEFMVHAKKRSFSSLAVSSSTTVRFKKEKKEAHETTGSTTTLACEVRYFTQHALTHLKQ